mgnify:CR=1 FL=1
MERNIKLNTNIHFKDLIIFEPLIIAQFYVYIIIIRLLYKQLLILRMLYKQVITVVLYKIRGINLEGLLCAMH